MKSIDKIFYLVSLSVGSCCGYIFRIIERKNGDVWKEDIKDCPTPQDETHKDEDESQKK